MQNEASDIVFEKNNLERYEPGEVLFLYEHGNSFWRFLNTAQFSTYPNVLK